jgi:hypothetical protein
MDPDVPNEADLLPTIWSPPADDESPTLDELAGILEGLNFGPVVQDQIGAHASQGTEALAFYIAYSVDSDLWGIYFNVVGMAAVTVSVAWELLVAGNAHRTLEEVTRGVWRTVASHELFHFAAEYAGATFEALTGPRIYRNGLAGPFRPAQEPLATAVEMRAARSRSGAKNDATFRAAFTEAWQVLPLPTPYDQWTMYQSSSDFEDGCRQLSNLLLGTSAGCRYIQDAVRLCRYGHRDLPAYTWTPYSSVVPYDLRALLPRIIPLDITRVMKHARLREKTQNPPGFVIDRAKGHPVKLTCPGRRPITLDTVKWRNVNYHIVKELAEFFSMKPGDYVAEVLAT